MAVIVSAEQRRDRVIWAAGFFDGEGCIGIAKQILPHRKDKPPNFNLSLRVSQTSREALEILESLWGGRVTNEEHHRPDKPQWRPYYNWRIGTKDARAALVEMLPYLIAKRAEAELAIEFQQRRKGAGKGCVRTSEEIEWDWRAYRQLRSLKRAVA